MIADARQLVIDRLRALQEQGLAMLPVDDEARLVLRRWMVEAKRLKMGLPPSSHAGVAEYDAVQPVERGAVASSLLRVLEEVEQEEAGNADPDDPMAHAVPRFRPGGSTDEERWVLFRRLLPRWTPMLELGSLRETPVFGQGDVRASLMFVGDAPNYFDEQARMPFAGEAGKKLDGILSAMGLVRDSVYLTELVKFRPALPRQTTNNRPPNEKEVALGASVLDVEIELVRPRAIVALGVIAARGLLRAEGDLPLSAFRGRSLFHGDVPVVVTHHPSYLLRTSDMGERRKLWEDMLQAMELAGLPVSDKQRSFFLPKG